MSAADRPADGAPSPHEPQDDAFLAALGWLNRCIGIEDDFRDGETYALYVTRLKALANDIASSLRAVERERDQLQNAVIELVRCVGRNREDGFVALLADDPMAGGWPPATLTREAHPNGRSTFWSVRALSPGAATTAHQEEK